MLEVYDAHLAALEADADPDFAEQRANYAKARPWIALAFEGVGAANLTGETVATALRRMLEGRVRGRRLRRVTARKYVTLAGSAWRWVSAYPLRTGLVVGAWPGLPRERGAASRRRCTTQRRPFSAAELAALLEGAELESGGIYVVPLRVLAETGCRVGEVVACDGGDVVRDSAGYWLCVTGKTGKRRVPLLAGTAELLGPRSKGAPLFLGATGKRLRSDVLRPAVHRIMRRAGVEVGVEQEAGYRALSHLDQHSFRRAWRTHAEEAGVSALHRRVILGHAASGVHDGYSRNYVPADLHRAVEAVAKWRQEQGLT